MMSDSICVGATHQFQGCLRLWPTTRSLRLWLRPGPGFNLIYTCDRLWCCHANRLWEIKVRKLSWSLREWDIKKCCWLTWHDILSADSLHAGVLSSDSFFTSSQVGFSELRGTFGLAPPTGEDAGFWLAEVWPMSKLANPWVSCSRLLTVWLDKWNEEHSQLKFVLLYQESHLSLWVCYRRVVRSCRGHRRFVVAALLWLPAFSFRTTFPTMLQGRQGCPDRLWNWMTERDIQMKLNGYKLVH